MVPKRIDLEVENNEKQRCGSRRTHNVTHGRMP